MLLVGKNSTKLFYKLANTTSEVTRGQISKNYNFVHFSGGRMRKHARSSELTKAVEEV